MNWGKGIALLYGSFVVFMVGLVYMCIQQKDLFLVTPEYYQEELAYQDRINGMQNVADLSSEVGITYSETGLIVEFPEECKESYGEISLYRPSNATKDISIPFRLSLNNKLDIATGQLDKGLWVLKLKWTKDEKDYYLEEKITI
jgi:hypothetical protein